MSRALMMSIAAVERDTGLSKDTLRIWEKRYGFPLPTRDTQGERCYPMEQVERLRDEFGIYAVGTGRICVAALNQNNLEYVAKAVATVAKG